MIVPFAAGGPADTVARVMAERMRTSLGQTVVIENVAGAGGSIGVGRIARAAPDGYTFGMGISSTQVVNPVIYALPYDVQTDFEPITLIASNPHFIVAKKANPANDLKEFIAWLKANPDKATAGTAGERQPAAPRRACSSSTPPAPASASCPIAAAGPRCRIWWPDRST